MEKAGYSLSQAATPLESLTPQPGGQSLHAAWASTGSGSCPDKRGPSLMTQVQIPASLLVAMYPLASHFNFSELQFLICKMGMTVSLHPGGCYEETTHIKGLARHKRFSPRMTCHYYLPSPYHVQLLT